MIAFGTNHLSNIKILIMKNLIIFCCLLFSFHLQAQNNSNSCKTIVLANDFEISASISSFETDYLIYRKCPDTSLVAYNLPIRNVKIIYDSLGQPDLLFSHWCGSDDSTACDEDLWDSCCGLTPLPRPTSWRVRAWIKSRSWLLARCSAPRPPGSNDGRAATCTIGLRQDRS